MAAVVAALTLGTVACGAAEGGDEYRAADQNRTGNPGPGWGPQAGDPLSAEGSERWGLGVLRYCPGSACVRTPGALPAARASRALNDPGRGPGVLATSAAASQFAVTHAGAACAAVWAIAEASGTC